MAVSGKNGRVVCGVVSIFKALNYPPTPVIYTYVLPIEIGAYVCKPMPCILCACALEQRESEAERRGAANYQSFILRVKKSCCAFEHTPLAAFPFINNPHTYNFQVFAPTTKRQILMHASIHN